MKKSTILLTSAVCGGIMLLGCTTPTSPANVAKSLESNLNSLTTTINKLDTIDNSYLSNPDIYPSTNVINVLNNKYFTKKVSTNNLNLFIPITKQKQKIAAPTLNLETETIKENPQHIVVDITTDTQNVDDDDVNKESGEIETVKDNNITNSTENSTNTLVQEPTTIIYYHETTPIKYVPRRGIAAPTNEEYLANYINKVRNLYAITNDAIVTNNELNNYKQNVVEYCFEIKELNNSIKNGTFVPTNQQIAALNNYIDDIKLTIKRIKKCNGDLSDEVDSINKTDVGGITAGIDVINSNYLSVLNHLETRIIYLRNALTTLEQIKYLLQEAQNIIQTNPTITDNNVSNEAIITPENNDENLDKETGTNTTNNNNNNKETSNTTINDIETENNETLNEEVPKPKTIDTYLNTNNNLDTYKPIIKNNSDVITVPETTAETIEEPANSNNNNVDTNNIPTINNGLNNAYNQTFTSDNVNAPYGTFENGIITQNNLGHGGQTNPTQPIVNDLNNQLNGNLRTNKNVDTYKNNTMIDMLNHGTVNNGINTLSTTDSNLKPVMVNNESATVIEQTETENNVKCIDGHCEDVNNSTSKLINNSDCENCVETTVSIDDCEDCVKIEENTETNLIESNKFCEDCTSAEAINSDSEIINAPKPNDDYKAELL